MLCAMVCAMKTNNYSCFLVPIPYYLHKDIPLEILSSLIWIFFVVFCLSRIIAIRKHMVWLLLKIKLS